MVRSNRALAGIAIAALLGTYAATAPAQGQSRPIRLVVPLAPGGTNDTLARIISERLGERLAQSSLSTGGAHVNAGRLRAIGVTTATRVPQLPEMPTFVESGFPDFEVNAWYGVLTTGRTPQARVNRLSTALQQTLAEAQTREHIQKQGLTVEASRAEQFANIIRRDTAKWAKVVNAAGIQPE